MKNKPTTIYCLDCGTSGSADRFMFPDDVLGDYGYHCPVCGIDESGLDMPSPENTLRWLFGKFIGVFIVRKKRSDAP